MSIEGKILAGRCEEVLASFPDNHFTAVVCDPPYGLSNSPDMDEVLECWSSGKPYIHNSKGFMGREWDSFVPGPNVWNEIMRTVEVGGHILSFSGTRTYDLMVKAMEIAGKNFDCRQSGYRSWVYGCLSEDSEILTENGWKLGVNVLEGEKVMTWDSKSESLVFGDVLEKFIAPFSGNMIAFKNDNTDQLLTPNHRVYKKSRVREMVNGKRESWFDKEWNVSEASEINRWNSLFVPLAGWHEGEGIGGEDYARLLGWVWTEGGFDHKPSTGVRIYQSSVNQEHVDEINELLTAHVDYHKHYDRVRIYKGREYTEHTWFFTGEMAQRVRKDLPDKHPTWDLLWRMTQDEKLAFMDAALKGDGSSKGDGKSWAFYQKDLADLEWFQTLLHMVGMQGRINEKKWCVALHDNSVTQFQCRHLKGNHEVPYDGMVWCVRVNTGAFMARRNGRIFITGNSGFPKSHNIGKAVGKAAGAEREVVRIRTDGNKGGGAKRWEGYGTALKPAHEPVAIFTKGDGIQLPTDSLFCYCAKANKKERNAGCDELYWLAEDGGHKSLTKEEYEHHKENGDAVSNGNIWPTVKPVELMRQLIRLVKKDGRNCILDPFMGSGTTLVAAILEGCDYVGIDADGTAIVIAEARVQHALTTPIVEKKPVKVTKGKKPSAAQVAGVKKFLASGLEVEVVARMVGLTVDQVEKLR